jgi:hypothetical protein
MTGQVFLAYLVVVGAELTVGLILGVPWWALLIVAVLTTAAFAAAAWLGLTRPDSGRHLAAKPDEAHRGKSATLGGWLHDTLWRNQRSDTGEIEIVDDETTEIDSRELIIDRTEAAALDLESNRRNPGE